MWSPLASHRAGSPQSKTRVRLHEPLAYPPLALDEKRGPELGERIGWWVVERRWWVVERPQDRLTIESASTERDWELIAIDRHPKGLSPIPS